MTINSATPGSDWFLNGLAALQRREERTQRELSSGYRIQDAADSPFQTPKLVALGSRLAVFHDWKANLGQVGAEVAGGDQAIGSAISLVENARSLAVRGSSPTMSANDRQSIATQIQSIQQELVSVANTNVQGRYIFGGDQDSAPPCQLDSTSPSGVTMLAGQSSTRVITGPDGDTIFQASSASHMFSQPGVSDAFTALENLRAALAGNNQAAIATALQSLSTVSDWLNHQQALYGTAGQRISDATNSAENEIISLRASMSEIRDTDLAQAAIDLTQESTSQSAAVAAQGQMQRRTLFDYLG